MRNAVGPSAQAMGFKVWKLLRMAQLALPVPPAFVLGTHYCTDADARQQASNPKLWAPAPHAVEDATGLGLGDARRPLLLAVRSGAPISMPGMMETILNVGLCDATVGALLRQSGNPRLVWDAYRRLVAGYGEIVARIPARLFAEPTSALVGEGDERQLDFADLRELTHCLLDVYRHAAGQPFPQEPSQQIPGAIEAVLASWQSAKACAYRRLNQISDSIGTAVTVHSMVFGNAGGRSGAGVGFTRDPSSGEPKLWVDFLFNAQEEDVVSGRRSAHGHEELAAVLPGVWLALGNAAQQLEHAFTDMQDFEFTVQEGRLFMLQTRAGKRTPQAAARIALDMLDQGLISAEVACERTAGLTRDALARSRIVTVKGAELVMLARAACASSGVAVGEIALDESRALARHVAGVPVLLVRRDAETDDLAALEAAAGLLTRHGARTSHAAVVWPRASWARCVSLAARSCRSMRRHTIIRIGDTTLREGELLTLDGNEGAIYAGAAQTQTEYPAELLARLDALRRGRSSSQSLAPVR